MAAKPKVAYGCPRDRHMTAEGLKEDNIVTKHGSMVMEEETKQPYRRL